MEPGILRFGIRNTDQGIRNAIKDLNPESKLQLQTQESSTYVIQNPRLSWILLHGAKQSSGLFRSVSPYETRSVLRRIVLWTEWTAIRTLPFLAIVDFHCYAVKNKHQKGV